MMHVDKDNRITFRSEVEDEVLRYLDSISGSLRVIAACLTGDLDTED